jgi:tRNA A37 methylthiotransferase MiaB
MTAPAQKDILLVTLNSTYQHCAFGLRYLYANLQELQPRAHILEWTIHASPRNVVEKILSYDPKIVGFGVYIWNTTETFQIVSILKKVAPEVTIVLGGPEVSHEIPFESQCQPICKIADYVIKGEADHLFHEFCVKALAQNEKPEQKFISGPLPDITQIQSPYSFYSDEDIKNRIVYVEVSRGCPFKCEYCLSSLDKVVRSFNLDQFLADMDSLIQRGTRQFKFVDRTFNLSIQTSSRILEFFLERIHLNLFLHFEMVPDRLPNELKELIKKFPHGVLQFEVGIQTWNVEVAKNVSRRNDYNKVRENFQFLALESGVHTHADLIVGLPGESLQSFGIGFDNLASCGPHEIQVGILKRLKGAPIVRHDREFQMTYQEQPPFQILCNKDISYTEMQRMNRFAKYWDLIANSGNFTNTTAWIKQQAEHREDKSFFWEFFALSEFLSSRFAETHSLALQSILEALWAYLTEVKSEEKPMVRDLLLSDYMRDKPRNVPGFLREGLSETAYQLHHKSQGSDKALPERQQRHLPKSLRS